MPVVTVDELTIPAGPGAPGWDEWVRSIEIRNAVIADATGTNALDVTPGDALPAFQNPRYSPRRIFAARVDGEIVGRGFIAWYTEPGTRSAVVYGEVLPAWRRQGIGSALIRRLEDTARAVGWGIFKAFPIHSSASGGERIAAVTGYGDLPLSDDGVHFLSRSGYRLQQVSRTSALELPIQPGLLAGMREQSAAIAGADYDVVHWLGPTPDALLEDLAFLRNRMSVDIPRGGMDSVEERWTPDRIRDRDARAIAGNRELLTVAARHVPSNRLIGFSVLSLPRNVAAPVMQEDTLVTREHRGHRLGMLMKIANLQELQRVAPEREVVITGNAEENRYMLSVNEAVGFRAIAFNGSWQKTLARPPQPAAAARVAVPS